MTAVEYATTTRKAFDHPYIAAVTGLQETLPGSFRHRLDRPYLSSSQIKLLRRCGTAYYFQYRLKHKETVSSRMFYGSSVHIGAETYFRIVREAIEQGNEPDLDFAAVAAADAARHYAQTHLPKPIIWDPIYKNSKVYETPESLITGVGSAVMRLATESWNQFRPVLVERGYLIEWRNPDVLPVLGYPDLVYHKGDEFAVMDNKTGTEKKALTAELDPGLSFYAMAHELFTGTPTRTITYVNFVRNKEPKIVRVDVSITEDHFERAYLRAAMSTETIRLGLYAPADDDLVCGGCQFRPNCREWLTIQGEARLAHATWPAQSVEPLA